MDNILSIDCSPNINDFTRLANMMCLNEKLFIEVLQSYDFDFEVQSIDSSSESTIKSDVYMEGQCFGMFPNFSPISRSIDEVSTLLRKVFKKKDTDSLSKVFNTLMQHPKEDIVMALIESMSKQNPDKQKEILDKVLGNGTKWKNKVSIEVIKRGEEQRQNRDSYFYYVLFRNLRNNQSRLVKFTNHASAAIYVMYLIDRVQRRDNCTPIDVLKNLDTLERIYIKMFETDEKIKGLKTIKILNDKGLLGNEKLRLSQYYSDINKTINENLCDWDFVFPYRCAIDSYVSLTPDWIFIPKDLIPDNWSIVV